MRGLSVVGQYGAYVGDRWGSGTFDKQINVLIPSMRVREGLLVVDRLMLGDLVSGYASRIRDEGVGYVGRPPIPAGSSMSDGLFMKLYESNHFAMRFIVFYDWRLSSVGARFDVIGSADA